MLRHIDSNNRKRISINVVVIFKHRNREERRRLCSLLSCHCHWIEIVDRDRGIVDRSHYKSERMQGAGGETVARGKLKSGVGQPILISRRHKEQAG